jgi:hypothetical protein
MSFTPLNLAPGGLVVAGLVALALGYPTLGWTLIGIPVGLGVLLTAWYLLSAWWQERRPPE